MAHYLVWFKGRNTSAVVAAPTRSSAIAKARAKRVTGASGPVVSARKANRSEQAQIRKGTWIRTRADGSKTSATGSYAFRPQLRPKR